MVTAISKFRFIAFGTAAALKIVIIAVAAFNLIVFALIAIS
jgi:hypothetical protein